MANTSPWITNPDNPTCERNKDNSHSVLRVKRTTHCD